MFDPTGTFDVSRFMKEPSRDPELSRLIISRQGGALIGRMIAVNGEEMPASDILAGAARMWMSVKTGRGPIELRMSFNGDVASGDWVGMFGNNGPLRARKTKLQ